MRKALVFTAVAFLLGTTAAFAQDKPVDVNIGGGYTFALSDIRDHLGDGYNVNFGVTFNLSESIGIQGEYSFNGLGQKNVKIPVLPGPGAGEPVPSAAGGAARQGRSIANRRPVRPVNIASGLV